MRGLGEYLGGRGITVHAPLLAGHGTKVEDLIERGWTDWLDSAREGLKTLRGLCSGSIFLCGQSVGGLLSLYMGGEEKGINGLISIGAALYLQNWKISLFLPLVKHTFIGSLYRFDRAIAYDINDPAGIGQMLCYDRTPVKAVVSLVELKDLVRARLPELKTPLLAAHGEQDSIVPPGNLEVIAREAGSQEVETMLCSRSRHLVTMDYDRNDLFKKIAVFIEKYK